MEIALELGKGLVPPFSVSGLSAAIFRMQKWAYYQTVQCSTFKLTAQGSNFNPVTPRPALSSLQEGTLSYFPFVQLQKMDHWGYDWSCLHLSLQVQASSIGPNT